MTEDARLQILLVDDHALAREGLRVALEIGNEIDCIEAASAEQALDLLSKGVPVDLVLMDISMPGMSGLDALRIVRARFPQLPVLMHSMHPEELYARQAANLGAMGCLRKGASPAAILDAVQSAARGESRFCT
jgi:DNA-binding NarL/FixJ family response regulator